MARFIVDYRFHARGSMPIQAESVEEAKAIVEAQVDNDGFEPPVDDYDDIDFDVREMHPVTRDGHEVWTTYVRASDSRGHASDRAA
ncbi:hypothetical protein [Bosea sp. LjRoot237]|uniref:hypothetical protein n=1 Tax=Bosea sp. LjRoot237 TaxID=3342292 RepID=UPI003ED046B4